MISIFPINFNNAVRKHLWNVLKYLWKKVYMNKNIIIFPLSIASSVFDVIRDKQIIQLSYKLSIFKRFFNVDLKIFKPIQIKLVRSFKRYFIVFFKLILKMIYVQLTDHSPESMLLLLNDNFIQKLKLSFFIRCCKLW